MGEITGIEWTNHTWNSWIGCQAISPACDHCYAETLVKRWGGDFAVRRRTAAANWKLPIRWNAAAEKAATRRKVFCASLADVFDNQVPVDWRTDLWAIIRATPWLDWQLLTKRPQNIAKMLPPDWGHGFHNVWLGTTVENQTEADRRIPILLSTPAAVRFLSCEPLLSAIDISPWILHNPVHENQAQRDVRLPGGSERRHRNPAGRDGLEGSETRVGSVEGLRSKPAMQSDQGRARHWDVLRSEGDARQNASVRPCSPIGMDSFSRSDSRSTNNQPQGREQEEQPSVQSRTGDLFRAATPRNPGIKSRARMQSVRGEEQHGDSERVAGGGDPQAPEVGGAPSADSDRLWDSISDGIKNRSWHPPIHLVIAGGESGPHARPMHPDWARSLRDQCKGAGVPFFMKQFSGLAGRPIKDMDRFPPDLRIREFPHAR